MDIARIGIGALVPAVIVAARFVIPGVPDDPFSGFFAVTGFLATLCGCAAAAVILRRRMRRTPLLLIAGVSLAVAATLLAIFQTMPSWPFTGVGFVVAWVLMSAGFMATLLLAVSFRYA